MKRVGLKSLGLISASKISNKAIMLAVELSRAVEKSYGTKIVLSDNQAISTLIDQITQTGDYDLQVLLSEFIEELIRTGDRNETDSHYAESEFDSVYLDPVSAQLI